MLRTVADDTPRPAAVTSTDEATGSPAAMYSRTSVASTSLDRSWGSISTHRMRLLKGLYSRELPSRALEQLADGRTSRAGDFGAIQVNRLAVVHQHLPVDNRRRHAWPSTTRRAPATRQADAARLAAVRPGAFLRTCRGGCCMQRRRRRATP